MFDSLSERLARTIKNLRGQGRLTEDNIKDTLREVRMALLEADVALPVVRDFVERVRVRAVGRLAKRNLPNVFSENELCNAYCTRCKQRTFILIIL